MHHNSALSSVNVLNRMLKRYGLPELYHGAIMTDDDINTHTNFDVIEEYTNFFLEILNTIENTNIRELEQEYGDMKLSPLHDIRKKIDKTSRDFGVKSFENGDIEFYDE